MKKRNNLYIIESPFQLISSIEAAHYFSCDNNSILIRYTDDVVTQAQINEVMKLYSDWAMVYKIFPRKSNLVTGINLLLLIGSFDNKAVVFDRIFIGDFRAWYVPYLLSLDIECENYLLDDGNSSIDIQENYLSKDSMYFGGGVKGLVKVIAFSLLRFLFRSKPLPPHLFTGFDLDRACQNQKIIKHNFEYWKTLYQDKKILNFEIFFFGGPISELRMLSLSREMELLEIIYKRYSASNIRMIYIPHRRDSSEKINHIKSILKIEVNVFRYCAEVELVLSEKIPSGIASFYSTTLLTLPKLFKFSTVEAFRFPVEELPKFHRAGVASVFSAYEKTMSVVDI